MAFVGIELENSPLLSTMADTMTNRPSKLLKNYYIVLLNIY